MTKKLNQINAFTVTTSRRNYIVTIERLKNDKNGNSRYKAAIVFLEEEEKKYYYTAVYSFTGHYCSDYGEAQYIVNYYEKTEAEA